MTASSPSTLIDDVCGLARRAGAEIMAARAKGIEAREKADGTPVTQADEAAEDVILEGLGALTPGTPIVAEESVARGDLPDVTAGPFWLVDPLDGTKEFISGRDEFTVNIALIEDGAPVLGVVYLPARSELCLGTAEDGAFRSIGDGPARQIAVRPSPAEGLTVFVSRSHRTAEVDAYLETVAVAEERSAGSSLKFCMLAAGEADLYPRFGRTMEWDTAAGDAVLRAAGGSVTTLDGEPLRYGKEGHENPDFIARGDPRLAP